MSGEPDLINIIDEVNYKINEVDYEIDEVNFEVDEVNYETESISSFQEVDESKPEPEPEKTIDVTFEDWHDQEDRNQITTANLEEIVSAGIKRKSKIALYDKCPIPGFEA
ncbi:20834_t:CDS:2, partial [Gigaspora margarita]